MDTYNNEHNIYVTIMPFMRVVYYHGSKLRLNLYAKGDLGVNLWETRDEAGVPLMASSAIDLTHFGGTYKGVLTVCNDGRMYWSRVEDFKRNPDCKYLSVIMKYHSDLYAMRVVSRMRCTLLDI